MKAKCTDAKPCERVYCYSCRRTLIDMTAESLARSVGEDAATKYRYDAINQLAFEVPATKPVEPTKPKAPKAPKASTALTLDAAKSICATLRTLTTRQAGRGELSAYRVVDLRVIAKACGLGGVSRYTKAELVLGLTEHLIGAQLNHQAIQDGVKA